MIKEGTALFKRGHGPVEPYAGKYAVRHADVFERIAARRRAAGLAPDDPYQLLRVEVELTTACNDSCPSCGMGALPVTEGKTFTQEQLVRLVEQFASVGLPSIAITGGEPFVRRLDMFWLMRRAADCGIDISKITTNGFWGTRDNCPRVFDKLEANGLLTNRLFVPLLMLSVGEQATPLKHIANIIHEAARRYTAHQLNIAVSSLADPATREHSVYDLMALYQDMFFEPFPHNRVHSTMRVYLNNDRLPDQAKASRPGHTSVGDWMGECYDCFAPTVGAYVLPTALLKQDGRLYSCAAFNVPEQLDFGNLFETPLREILERVNASRYVQRVAAGGGLAALHGAVPEDTIQQDADSFCGSCAVLVAGFDAQQDTRTGNGTAFMPLSALTQRPVA